jgi:kinesin family protein 13
MTKSEKLDKAESMIEKFDENQAHLVNLNEDPMLSKKIKYPLDKDRILIGRKNVSPANDIVVGGVGVRSHHATIVNRDGAYYLEPTEDEQGDFNCFINGQLVAEPTRMFHEDRVVLGSNSTFLILLPGEDRRIGPEITGEIDWEFAQEEMYRHKKAEKNEKEEEQHEKELKQREEQEHALKEK